jgi:excisionase family DNA binding protein
VVIVASLAQTVYQRTMAIQSNGQRGKPIRRRARMTKAAVSVSEWARAYGVSPGHAYRLAASGKLPVLRLGRALRVPIDAADRLLAVRAHDGVPVDRLAAADDAEK